MLIYYLIVSPKLISNRSISNIFINIKYIYFLFLFYRLISYLYIVKYAELLIYNTYGVIFLIVDILHILQNIINFTISKFLIFIENNDCV